MRRREEEKAEWNLSVQQPQALRTGYVSLAFARKRSHLRTLRDFPEFTRISGADGDSRVFGNAIESVFLLLIDGVAISEVEEIARQRFGPNLARERHFTRNKKPL